MPACSNDDGDRQPSGAGSSRISAPLRLADCRDWEEATIRQRRETIKDLEEFLGGPAGSVPGGRGATLDDSDAYELFERYCSKRFARGFKLYKLYSRAAAFTKQR